MSSNCCPFFLAFYNSKTAKTFWGKNKMKVIVCGHATATATASKPARNTWLHQENHFSLYRNSLTWWRRRKEILGFCFTFCAVSFLSLSQPVWRDLAKFCHFGKILKFFWQFLKSLVLHLANFEPTLAFLCYWANFHRGKWPKFEK